MNQDLIKTFIDRLMKVEEVYIRERGSRAGAIGQILKILEEVMSDDTEKVEDN